MTAPTTSAHSAPIVVRDLSVTFGRRTVLNGFDLVAQPGRRIGLIGENGAGKSTLLRAVAGALPREAHVVGRIERPADLAFLTQEPPFRDSDTVADAFTTALRPLRDVVAKVEALAGRLLDPEMAQEYSDALDEALAHDAWNADRRALVAAQQLGLGGIEPDRRIGGLSGGERTRLALATLMARRPHCLLLDEPTNHLDDEAAATLVAFLRDLPGVVLFASHDRVFLDEVCTDLVDLDPVGLGVDGHGGRRYGGGWTAYADLRAAARRRWEETYAAQQQELDRLREAVRLDGSAVAHNRGPRDNDKFIYGFKGQNVDRTVARRKRDAQRKLEIAESEQVRKPPAPLHLRAELGSARSAGRVITVRDLVVAGRLTLPALDVEGGEHLLVTGPNGSGKSTLLGVLSSRLTASSGTVHVSAQRVAELTQDPQFPDLTATAASAYETLVGPCFAHRRPLRDLGLLQHREHSLPVALLSVGQRRRLAFAVALASGPDLLLLDEPTNHISLTLVRELEEAVERSPSTIVVASHDRWLRQRWQGSVVESAGWSAPSLATRQGPSR